MDNQQRISINQLWNPWWRLDFIIELRRSITDWWRSTLIGFHALWHLKVSANAVNHRNNKAPTELKTESSDDANFVVTGGTGVCHYDNLRCHQWTQLASSFYFVNFVFTGGWYTDKLRHHQWRQSWHRDNSWVSVCMQNVSNVLQMNPA